MKNKFIDDLTKFTIKHNNKNVLDLEDTSSSCEEGEPRYHSIKNAIAEKDLDTLKHLDEIQSSNNTKMLTGIMSKGQQKNLEKII